jgi:multimeric flavodoxin WrbA
MRVLGISGSPRAGGNTEGMIEEALKIVRDRGFETDHIYLSENEIKPCTACGRCSTAEECPIGDDMQDAYAKLREADAIIVASPVYFGSPTAQIKALFDRSVLLRRNNFRLAGKPGAAMAVGGSRNGGQEKTVQVIQDWMHIHGMIVVGDGGHFGGICHKPAAEDEEGRETVRATANRVCDVLDRMKQ